MILFSPLRTQRLNVRLEELRGDEIIGLLSRPAELLEAGTTEFLRFAAAKAQATARAHVTDPRLMTVQERMRLCAHYMSTVSDDGADFVIGEQRMSDYLLHDRDWDGSPVDLTEPGGRRTRMWPLLGWMAEALELVSDTVGDWQCGALGCQLYYDNEQPPSGASFSTVQAIEWAKARRAAVTQLRESELLHALDVWEQGSQQLLHFFAIDFQADGIVAMPHEDALKEAGAKQVAPARFPGSMCISPFARQLFGKHLRASS